MSKYISRFDIRGRSISNKIYHGVESGQIRLIARELSDGKRLDHYAQVYYGNGLNWWIIAAASGIRWPLGIGPGNANRENNEEQNTVILIPNLEDVLKLKE